MRKLLLKIIYFAWAAALAACSNSQPVPDVAKPGDQRLSELGPVGDGPRPVGEAGKADTLRPPDGPKPPAVWKVVSGEGPQVRDSTAILLNDGRVLVTGGFRYPSPTQTVPQYQKGTWLFQPDTNSFVPAGQMVSARTSHTASLLPDGKVLIAGGYDGSTTFDTTEIFDPAKPAAGAWSAGPKLAEPRASHLAASLADGRVVLAGGRGEFPDLLGSITIFKPSTGSFQSLASTLNPPRSGMAGTLLKNGKVLLAGGDDDSSAFSKVMEVLDPQAGSVTALSVTMTDKKTWPFAFTLPSGKVLITTGYAFAYPPRDDLYDPTTNTLNPISHPGGSARGSAATLLADGRVLVVGGFETAQEKKVRAFNENGLAWDTLPEMLKARSYLELVTLKDGSVLAISGMEGSKYSFPTESERLYNP